LLQEFSECRGENILILPTKCSVILRTLIAHQTSILSSKWNCDTGSFNPPL